MSTFSNEKEKQIEALIASGNKIAAIALYREMTGVSLKEAKDAVEAMQQGLPVSFQVQSKNSIPVNDALLEAQVRQLLAQRQKIEAVKIYREAHQCGLKDAKDAVDIIESQMKKEMHRGLPSTLANNDDPFAEDGQRSRTFLAIGLALFIVLLGGFVFIMVLRGGF